MKPCGYIHRLNDYIEGGLFGWININLKHGNNLNMLIIITMGLYNLEMISQGTGRYIMLNQYFDGFLWQCS